MTLDISLVEIHCNSHHKQTSNIFVLLFNIDGEITHCTRIGNDLDIDPYDIGHSQMHSASVAPYRSGSIGSTYPMLGFPAAADVMYSYPSSDSYSHYPMSSASTPMWQNRGSVPFTANTLHHIGHNHSGSHAYASTSTHLSNQLFNQSYPYQGRERGPGLEQGIGPQQWSQTNQDQDRSDDAGGPPETGSSMSRRFHFRWSQER